VKFDGENETNPGGCSTQISGRDSINKAERDGGYDNSSPLKHVPQNYTTEVSLISGKEKENSAPPGHRRYNTMSAGPASDLQFSVLNAKRADLNLKVLR